MLVELNSQRPTEVFDKKKKKRNSQSSCLSSLAAHFTCVSTVKCPSSAQSAWLEGIAVCITATAWMDGKYCERVFTKEIHNPVRLKGCGQTCGRQPHPSSF